MKYYYYVNFDCNNRIKNLFIPVTYLRLTRKSFTMRDCTKFNVVEFWVFISKTRWVQTLRFLNSD